jgi:hypothetical protein
MEILRLFSHVVVIYAIDALLENLQNVVIVSHRVDVKNVG